MPHQRQLMHPDTRPDSIYIEHRLESGMDTILVKVGNLTEKSRAQDSDREMCEGQHGTWLDGCSHGTSHMVRESE